VGEVDANGKVDSGYASPDNCGKWQNQKGDEPGTTHDAVFQERIGPDGLSEDSGEIDPEEEAVTDNCQYMGESEGD